MKITKLLNHLNFTKMSQNTKDLRKGVKAQINFIALMEAAKIPKFDLNHVSNDFIYQVMEENGFLNQWGLSVKGKEDALGLGFLSFVDRMRVITNELTIMKLLIQNGKLTGEEVLNFVETCKWFLEVANTQHESTIKNVQSLSEIVMEEVIEPEFNQDEQIEVPVVKKSRKKVK